MTERYTVVEDNKYGTFWYKEGTKVLHRVGGPARECVDGTKSWWLDGKCHREDGPAREYSGGHKEWWLNDEHLTEAQWKERMNPVKEMTVAQIEQALGYKVKVVKGP